MTFSISNFILTVRMHGIKDKTLTHQLDTYWITEELSAHRRYSPFMLEVQKNQDLKTNLWPLGIFATFVLVLGLILCACSHWAIQLTGVSVCLLATSMISNIGTAIWQTYKTGVLSNKEVT